MNLQKLYTLASDWFAANGLVLNSSKTQAIMYVPSACTPIPVAPIPLSESEHVYLSREGKCLGITLDCHLSWKVHTTALIAKLHSLAWALRTLTRVATPQCCLVFYHANIVSHLRYGIALWGGCPSANDVFVEQKKLVRVLYGRPFNSSCRQLFIQEKILTTPSLYMLECIQFSILNKLITPDDLSPAHGYNSRHKSIKNAKVRLNVAMRNVRYASVKLFNALPQELKLLFKRGDISSFIRHLHRFLLNSAFYSVEELTDRSQLVVM